MPVPKIFVDRDSVVFIQEMRVMLSYSRVKDCVPLSFINERYISMSYLPLGTFSCTCGRVMISSPEVDSISALLMMSLQASPALTVAPA